jgi:hypothetical protein
MVTRLGTLLILCLSTLLLPLPQDPTPFDARGYPSEMTALAVLTTQRCSKCHTLSRVLESRIRGDAWEPEVFTMMEKEKSGISEAEAEDISRFLAAWSTFKKASQPSDRVATPKPTSEGGLTLPPFGHAVASEVIVEPTDVLPKGCILEGRTFVLEAVTARTDGGVTARVTEGAQTHDVGLVPGTDGVAVPQTSPLRTWTVGRHVFSLELGLSRVDNPVPEGARPGFRLAALVRKVHGGR